MYDYELKSIWFSNGNRIKFRNEIAEILDFEESIIVRLVPGTEQDFRNVFGLDYRGNLLWQIPHPRSFPMQTPYVMISRNGGYLDAMSWDGRILRLHPMLGTIVQEDQFSSQASSSHRVPSVRRWV
jgi:hypothetical protein